MSTNLAGTIDALLPQMQCGRCGYRSCQPYAEALSRGEAELNQCTPGGASLVVKLTELLGRAGGEVPEVLPVPALKVVAIVEQDCIGCTKCIQMCPVTAILGAPKRMHTVLTDLCTGCELCIPACPVDCMVLEPAPFIWDEQRAVAARSRYEAQIRRQSEQTAESGDTAEPVLGITSVDSMREEIAAAVARRRAQRHV